MGWSLTFFFPLAWASILFSVKATVFYFLHDDMEAPSIPLMDKVVPNIQMETRRESNSQLASAVRQPSSVGQCNINTEYLRHAAPLSNTAAHLLALIRCSHKCVCVFLSTLHLLQQLCLASASFLLRMTMVSYDS